MVHIKYTEDKSEKRIKHLLFGILLFFYEIKIKFSEFKLYTFIGEKIPLSLESIINKKEIINAQCNHFLYVNAFLMTLEKIYIC